MSKLQFFYEWDIDDIKLKKKITSYFAGKFVRLETVVAFYQELL